MSHDACSRGPGDEDSATWDRRWESAIAKLRSDRHEDDLRPISGMLETWSIPALRLRGARTALFAGCGIEQTPKAFALAGFEAVGLDYSRVAIEFAGRHALADRELRLFFQRSLSGDRAGGDFSREYARPGGSWRYAVGDFMDPSVERGPFDYVSATRSLQGARARDVARVVEALDARVSPGGLIRIVIQNDGELCLRYRKAFIERGYPPDDVAAPGKVVLDWLASG